MGRELWPIAGPCTSQLQPRLLNQDSHRDASKSPETWDLSPHSLHTHTCMHKHTPHHHSHMWPQHDHTLDPSFCLWGWCLGAAIITSG